MQLSAAMPATGFARQAFFSVISVPRWFDRNLTTEDTENAEKKRKQTTKSQQPLCVTLASTVQFSPEQLPE